MALSAGAVIDIKITDLTPAQQPEDIQDRKTDAGQNGEAGPVPGRPARLRLWLRAKCRLSPAAGGCQRTKTHRATRRLFVLGVIGKLTGRSVSTDEVMSIYYFPIFYTAKIDAVNNYIVY